MSEDKRQKIKKGLIEIVGRNLKSLMVEEGYTTETLIQELEKEYEYVADISTLSKIINTQPSASLQLILLVQCAKFFHVTLDDLVDENFSLQRRVKRQSMTHYPDINKFLAEDTTESDITKSKRKDTAFNTPIFLESIAEKYFCYFYPTSSWENRKEKGLLRGELTFSKSKNKYDIIFTIFIPKKDSSGNMMQKKYYGEGVYSVATNSMYCILQDNIEYCFIVFRSFYYNDSKQDCFMAHMLSSSSATKDRYPTALRAFLSREEIAEEHLEFIKPHLCINFSEITISVEELENFKSEYKEYSQIVDILLERMPRQEVCVFKEKNLKPLFDDSIEQKRFIARLRSYMKAFHYTKVGDTIQDGIRDILKELDYYKEK